MPVIQQENGVKSVKGLPERWGRRAYGELSAARDGVAIGAPMPARYAALASMLDDLTSAPLGLDMTEAQLCMMAEECANECVNAALDLHTFAPMRKMIECIVREYHVEPAEHKDDQQAVLRYMDAAWWRKKLRTIHSRTREHAAMRLGFVSSKAGKYCSDEAAKSRVAQNRRNAHGMKNTKLLNVETGQEFGLDELAKRGMGNKEIRKGELMLRMDGCDEISQELGHKGLFVTLTAPGAYHSVHEKSGEPNENYNLATPRETQDYLRGVWVLTRAQNARDGISPYGFRVAEPHHDGCTHWHMVLFMPAEHLPIFIKNLSTYALAEDGDAPGAQEKRVTFAQLDPTQGSAAAYLMKYVGKNIGENEIREDEEGRTIITKEMRVDAWAGVWGIRQFQPIGQPPVTGYREFRRVPEAEVEGAPEHVRAAWLACNRIDLVDEETGEIAGTKKCSFAAYIRAQGGVNMGRDYRIAIATEEREVEGRYGLQARECPIGLYSKADIDKTYKSTRYTWKRLGLALGAAVRSPWSTVNNCTGYATGGTEFGPSREVWFKARGELVACFDDEWFQSDEYQKIFVPPEVVAAQWLESEGAANEVKATTIFPDEKPHRPGVPGRFDRWVEQQKRELNA